MKTYNNYENNLRKRRTLKKIGYTNIVIKKGVVISKQGEQRIKPEKKKPITKEKK